MGFNLGPEATQLSYFASLVQSDEQFPLLEAAASLAQDEYPECDVQQVLADVDQILARLKRRLAPDASALHRLKILNRLFFEELGFQGNVNHYHDPDNSFLNAVLQTRRGIPISLSVIWLELAPCAVDAKSLVRVALVVSMLLTWMTPLGMPADASR